MGSRRHILLAGLFMAAAVFLSCPGVAAQNVTQKSSRKALRSKCQVISSSKHDVSSYTQGLFFYGGKLYESAGQYGESSMRIVDPATGKVLKRKNFDRNFFIEGSCIVDGRLYVLSWREGICFILNPDTLDELGRISYRGEGWGLTTDGKSLIMSDGSSHISFRNPKSFHIEREITVRLDGKELPYLNELEYIGGEIWANVYGTDYIVIINPSDGNVREIIDCRGILSPSLRKPSTDVLNGIALDPATGNIHITGKYWPKMFRIKAVQK